MITLNNTNPNLLDDTGACGSGCQVPLHMVLRSFISKAASLRFPVWVLWAHLMVIGLPDDGCHMVSLNGNEQADPRGQCIRYEMLNQVRYFKTIQHL